MVSFGSAKYFNNIAEPATPDQNFGTRRGELNYIYTASKDTINTAAIFASSTISQPATAGDHFRFFRFDNYLSMGAANPDSRNARNQYVIRDGLTTRKGKHSLRFAAELDQYQANSFWPAYPAGEYTFSYGITSLPGIVDTGYSFASFLLGLAHVIAPSSPRAMRLGSPRIAFANSRACAANMACDAPAGDPSRRFGSVCST